MNYQFLYDDKESLKNKINTLLDSEQFYWSEIYIFSAFFDDAGVTQVKQILSADFLTEDAKVVIAIGSKNFFNEIKNIKKILDFIESEKSKKPNNKSVHFICPKKNFHIKAYCFLGRSRNVKIKADIQIGVSIIGSSNLTRPGLECEGELCISIHNFNLTKTLIARLSEIYIDSKEYDLWEKIIDEYQNNQYNSWEQKIKEFAEKINKYNGESSENQNEVLPPSQENSTSVNQDQQPIPNRSDGKFIELGVLTDSDLIAKATNLVNGREKINCFHSSPTTLEEAKEDFREGSLCLLFSTENKIFQIGEIMPHSSDQETTEGCFVRYRVNVTYKPSDDIDEILTNEKYKIISDAKDMEELPYEILKDFEEEVNEYQEYQKMLADPKYQKWIEKGKKKTQLEIIDRILEIGDPTLMKKELELLRQSI
ncbi:phospholipase D family protein [Tychonema sp. LEGE 06208]|uniref:phospholipase D family protein n=1 Tax=Tychonema sp. LEGE 06208 TaxID=1828663 RepID=UPI00187F234B|nr:phospholipase D family protein [Tychonema sp. LEGE 06208]MBE9161770.1 phospholipase D family protein [Tychonema sp. LEGE 06208]